MGSETINDKKNSLNKETNDPEFYQCYEFKCTLPGSAVVRIEVWDDDLFQEDIIGFTEIDVENRYFSP